MFSQNRMPPLYDYERGIRFYGLFLREEFDRAAFAVLTGG